MSGPRVPGFHTLALHAGGTAAKHDPAHSPAHHPVALLEERIAALEGGVAAIATVSAQAALHLGLSTISGAGDHIVASSSLAGSARALLAHTLPRFGVGTTFVDPRDIDAWRAAIRPTTRVLLGESLGAHRLEVLDIPRLAELAHQNDVPLMVDATAVTPYLQRPLDLGADLLLHSAQAYLGVGGLLIDGGTFDWQAAHERGRRFATLCEPCERFGGAPATEESTVGAFALQARAVGLADFGAAIGAHDALTTLHGIESLGLRMERHLANTRRVADFLLSHPMVESVTYPELGHHPDHALATRLLPRGCGAVLMFALKGDAAATRRLLESLQLFTRAHVVDGAVRLTVGLEDPHDLIDDLERGLKLARKGV